MLLSNVSYVDENFHIRKGDLEIEGGIIRSIQPHRERRPDRISVDCTNYTVIPGLNNAHFHGYSLTAKGLAREKRIEQWTSEDSQGKLQSKYFDNISKLSQDEYQTVCQKAYVEMVRMGITFLSESDPGLWPDGIANTINEVGISGVVDCYDKIGLQRGPDQSSKVRYVTHLLEEEDITDDTLAACKALKQVHGDCIFQTHSMENLWRKKLIYEKYGHSSVELFFVNGLLDSKTVLFHATHLNELDIHLLSKSETSVVHCPVSNFWTGAGIAPVGQMLEKGVNVCIGTDYASADIWEAMRVTYYLLKYNLPVSRFNAQDVLKMATINGAKAYKRDNVGIVKEGFIADLVFIKKDDLIPVVDTDEFSNQIHNLLFETKESAIRHVMVHGEWIMYDRCITKINEVELNEKYKGILSKIYNDINND